MLGEICEVAKQEMKDKKEDELGSRKRALTIADGMWQMCGWQSKNATFTIRNYLNGALLYYLHLCQKGRDTVIKRNYTKAHQNLPKAMLHAKRFRGPNGRECKLPSTGKMLTVKAVSEVFPDTKMITCGGHAGHTHKNVGKNAPKSCWIQG